MLSSMLFLADLEGSERKTSKDRPTELMAGKKRMKIEIQSFYTALLVIDWYWCGFVSLPLAYTK
jgi:hypothetical protein